MRISFVVSALAILLSAGALHAQNYPSRPITIVVPLPAGGGGADLLARIIGERLKLLLGEPVIVENIPGAGGSIATGRVARAEPDGYTLIVGSWISIIGASAVYPISYDVLNDLEPIAHLTDAPYWIVARKNLPVSNLSELAGWLKENSAKANAATLGAGSGSHICTKYLEGKSDLGLQLVPYRGGPTAMQDLAAGRIDIMCDFGPNSLSYVRGGAIKALAVMAKSRWFASPDTPTVDESGMQGFYLSSWQGLLAPKGTPNTIVEKLNEALAQTLAEPAVREKITNLGQVIASPAQQKPDAFAALIKHDAEKWWPIIKAP